MFLKNHFDNEPMARLEVWKFDHEIFIEKFERTPEKTC